MADLLNGQPIGPKLPPAVKCEGCGHPVYCTEGATVYRGDQPVTVRGVYEQTFIPNDAAGFPQPHFTWALAEHHCRRRS